MYENNFYAVKCRLIGVRQMWRVAEACGDAQGVGGGVDGGCIFIIFNIRISVSLVCKAK